MRTGAFTSGLDIQNPNRSDRFMTRARVLQHALYKLVLASTLAAVPFAAVAAVAPRAGAGHTTQRVPGYLGIEFHDLTQEQAAGLHLRKPYGVEVLLVDHDGPAGHVGIQPHDIITGLNGKMVSSGEALRRMIHDAGAGVPVSLNIFRDGHNVVITTKLANREDVERRAWARVTAQDPPPPVMAGVDESYGFQSAAAPAPAHGQSFLGSMLHGGSFTGMMLDSMQPQLASYFGAPKGQGLLVQSVEPNSPAALAGVQAADIVLRADGVAMRSQSDWTKHLRASKGKPISLAILRQHRELTLSLQPSTRHR